MPARPAGLTRLWSRRCCRIAWEEFDLTPRQAFEDCFPVPKVRIEKR